MANNVAKQEEMSAAAAEALAQYQVDLDAWQRGRRRQIGALVACVVIQLPLWWVSAIAASVIHVTETWAWFFSVAMFLGAGVFGIITIITFVALITDAPPTRPSVIRRE